VVKGAYGIDGPYLLHVGTLEPRKNLSSLLRAYASLRRSGAIDHKLVLAGDRGWGYEPLLGLAEELGVVGDALFLGRVPAAHLPALYNDAELLVYPTLYEGFGLPALEAMACGLPVIASNTSSLPEVLGEAGLFVDATDERTLAEAIVRVLDDADLSARMRSLGLERARLFSWERCGRETLAVYEDALRR